MTNCSLFDQGLIYFENKNNLQLLDKVEQNIVICLWRADQLFAEAEGWSK